MSRYFFHLLDGKYHIDDVGTELAGSDEARSSALKQMSVLLDTKGRSDWNRDRLRVWVTDEKGATLFTLAFDNGDQAEEARFDRIPAVEFFSDPRMKHIYLID
jgi:hypothetical protein